MNRDQSDRDYGQHESSFHTHRSERYRHPERDTGHRFDTYGSSARGGYGNEEERQNWGRRGTDMSGSRHYTDIHVTPYDRFEQSPNYGSMGSYGGAQGFGDSRGGRHDSGHPFDSGMSSARRDRDQSYSPTGYRGYGSENLDEEREGRQRDYYTSRRSSRQGQEDLYGRDTSRRFQGGGQQGRYDFERDNYYSSDYGDDQGNYMGSGYHRMTQSNYGTGDYGSMGYIEQRRQDRERQERERSREFNTAQNRWYTDW